MLQTTSVCCLSRASSDARTLQVLPAGNRKRAVITVHTGSAGKTNRKFKKSQKMQMQECLSSKKDKNTASALFKNFITDRSKMNTELTVANSKAMSYMLQHNLMPKYSVLYFLPIVHTLPILRLFCGFAVCSLGFFGLFLKIHNIFNLKSIVIAGHPGYQLPDIRCN